MAWLRRRKFNSLGLWGDGDDVAILRDVERVFGIRLLESELSRVRTVGQLHDLVLAKLPANSFGPDDCLSAGAFHRLRRALNRMGDFGRLSPGSEIGEIIGKGSVRRFWRRLERVSGLTLPEPQWGSLGVLTGVASIMLFLAALPLTAMTGNPIFLLLFPVALLGFWAAARVFPLRVPEDLSSLGQLSRSAVHENFRNLADARQTFRADDVWDALEYVIRKETGTESPICRKTVFFDRDHPSTNRHND